MGNMNRILSLVVVIGSLVFFAASGHPTAGAAAEPAQRTEQGNRVDIVSAHPFARTVDNLTKALKEQGMMIVATIDHQNMLTVNELKERGVIQSHYGSITADREKLKRFLEESPC